MWVKLDDNVADHPKILAAGAPAFALWVAALCWSNRHLTDGRITPVAARSMAASFDLDLDATAARLCDVGLWVADGDGFAIHDFADYQPSAAEAREKREGLSAVRAEAGRLGAMARWHGKPIANGSQIATDGKWQTDSKPMANAYSPVPSRPVPDHHQGPSVDNSPGEANAAEDDDRGLTELDRLIADALAVLADREAKAQSERGNVPRGSGWFSAVMAERKRRHWPRIVELIAGNPEMTADDLAEALEPSSSRPATPRDAEVARLESLLAGLKLDAEPDVDTIHETEAKLAELKRG
jgi:hypothetical protein